METVLQERGDFVEKYFQGYFGGFGWGSIRKWQKQSELIMLIKYIVISKGYN